MNRPPDARREKQLGQAMVEFALVSVLFVTLVVAIADFARLYFTYSAMNNAAREGTRYGVVNPNDTDGIRNRATSLLITFAENPTVDISFPDGTRTVGARVRVAIAADFAMLVVPIPPMRINADSTMRIEYVPVP